MSAAGALAAPVATPPPADPVAAAREFARTVLAAAPPTRDTVYDDAHPHWRAWHALGMAHWWLPASVGGAGVSLRTSVDVVAELAAVDPGFAFTAFLPILGSRMLELYGEPEVAGPHLRAMAAHGAFCAAMGSEHAAGSELVNTGTTVRREGDELVIDGEKAFSTNLAFARVGLVLARDAGSPRSYSMVAVPAGTPGFVPCERWAMTGLHGTATHAATLRGVRVPASHELRGGGLRVLEAGLNASRILMSAIAIGIARRARDLSMEYAATKQLGGAPLSRNAVFAARLGQAEMELEVIKATCYAAADEYDRIAAGPDPAAAFLSRGALKSAVVAKMHAGQAGFRLVSAASESFGGLGYTDAHPIGALLRDVRHISIVEAGDDVLRDVLYARYVQRAARRG